jgi:heme-degrading monooxygenase HmoA
MTEEEKVFTSGSWFVKHGKEKESVSVWKDFADWTLKSQRGMIEAFLLQDQDDSRRFTSYGPWKDAKRIKEWGPRPEFKDYLARL